MKRIVMTLFVTLVLVGSAQAQVGRLLKEGVEAAGKKVFGRTTAKASQEGAEQALKKAATSAAREAGQESLEAVGRRTANAALRGTDEAARAVGLHGRAIATPLIEGFGDAGANALVRLSPTSARRMAMLTEELAAGGRGADWMRVIADKGDIAADWIWKNKGSLAVAATATAFLANPDAFLLAGENVTTEAIEAASEHVARPLIEETIGRAVPQVAHEIAKPAVAFAESAGSNPVVVVVLMAFVSGFGVLAYCFWIRPWLAVLGRR